MADYFDAGKFGSIVAIPFSDDNIAASATATDLILKGGGTLIVAPYSGSIVAIGAMVNAAVTGGILTVNVHKASTEFAAVGTPAPVLDTATYTTYSYGTVRPGAVTFSAGDTLGLSYTTTAGFLPDGSLDLDAVLYIQLNAV